jgi:hypothetical protein
LPRSLPLAEENGSLLYMILRKVVCHRVFGDKRRDREMSE